MKREDSVAATTSLEVSVRWWYIRNIFQLQALKSPHIDVRSSDLDDDTVPFLYKHVELRGRVRGGHASGGGGGGGGSGADDTCHQKPYKDEKKFENQYLHTEHAQYVKLE
ncbi:hypothetical protein HZH68_013242 [Vespula germanica]|uniref:Uncharacterized protein n=1 Tax=Vespula germanica TaxID=30212 RepID=A0A834JDQ0_VESGE|nr:hypothetical protein HZH68_013242 [Vespula germanica]